LAQIYIFYMTLLELQKLIGRVVINVEPEASVLHAASEHNMNLLSFFLKLLMRTDGGRTTGLAGQVEAREFQEHFGYLRQVFPFL
jgi:hypothetical protein